MFSTKFMSKLCFVYALTFLVACGTGLSSSEGQIPTMETYVPGGADVSCINFRVESPKTLIEGAELQAQIITENTCDSQVALMLSYNISEDLLVVDKDSNVLWQYFSEPRQSVLKNVILEAGDRLSANVTWNGKDADGNAVPVGSYQIVGILYLEDSKRLENVQDLTITAQ
jgi:hypothetical protein